MFPIYRLHSARLALLFPQQLLKEIDLASLCGDSSSFLPFEFDPFSISEDTLALVEKYPYTKIQQSGSIAEFFAGAQSPGGNADVQPVLKTSRILAAFRNILDALEWCGRQKPSTHAPIFKVLSAC